jgi:hypothetical protein
MTLGASIPQGPGQNAWLVKAVNNLTAAGSSQGNAYVIPAGQDGSIFTTVASSTGAILPASGVQVGEEYVIANHGSNSLSVYPPSGGKMGTASANTAYSLTAGKTGYFMYVGGLQWTTNP